MEKVSVNNDLTLQVNTKSKDELADMAKAFNTMLNNFRHLIIEVNGSVKAVNQATDTLSENIHMLYVFGLKIFARQQRFLFVLIINC